MALTRRCLLLVTALLAAASFVDATRGILATPQALPKPAAASSLDPKCPYSALYVVATLPKIKTQAAWNAVKGIYIAAWLKLMPAGSSVIPTHTEPMDGALSVHTILVFNGTVASGKAAALNLHVRLLGDPRPFFSGTAVASLAPAHFNGGIKPNPTPDLSPFGDVHFESISHPYLSDSVGRTIVGNIPATNAAAQFSMEWTDMNPAQLGQLEVKRYEKAIQAKMPPGTYVQFTPMIDDGVSTYRFNSWAQSTAAAAAPTVAHHLGGGGGSWGGAVRPPTTTAKAVWNTAVTNTTTVALDNLLALLRKNPALVFPTAYFKRMRLEGGSGVRLVPTPAFVSACAAKPVVVKRPILTSAVAYGPTTGQAIAAPAAGVTYTSWIFTATAPDGVKVSVQSLIPEARWGTTAATALRPNTKYIVSVVGIQADGTPVAASNTLPMQTPPANTPSIPAADPTSQTSAAIVLNAPPGATALYFLVKLCPQPSGTCLDRTCPDIFCDVKGLSAGAKYTVSAQAMVAGKLIPASNTLPLQMPAPGAPTLVDAQARSSTRGYALAAPPPGGCDTYVFTFAPVNGAGAGGQPVVRELADNQYNVGTLTPSTTYDVSVQCKKGGVLSGPSNVKQIVTAAANAPANEGVPTSPTKANIQLRPPNSPAPSGSPWTSYQVTVCPVQGPSTKCVRKICTASPCPISGLSPATTYIVQSVAIAADGSRSVPSNEAPFTTPSQPPTPPTPDAAATGPTEAEITVKAPTVGGPCAKYALRICPTLNNPAGCFDRDCGPPAVTVSPTGTTTCPAITGLTEKTSYTVTATCIKADGSKGPTSAPETFATPAAGIPAVSADPVNAVTGVARCTKPSNGGDWKQFELTVCKKAAPSQCLQNLPLCTITATVTNCPIPGCTPGTEYEVTIVAIDADGTTKSPESNTDPFTTPKAPAPGVSVNDAATSTTSTTAKVTPPALPKNFPWDNYKLTVCQTATANCKVFNCKPGEINACPITGLLPATFYNVKVVAQKAGVPDSLVGGPDTFRTASNTAPIVAADAVNAASAKALCTKPSTRPASGTWAQFELTVCKKGTSQCLQNLPLCPINPTIIATSCPIANVEPGTAYDVTIYALDGSGNRSPISNKDDFTTPKAPAPGVSVNDAATSTTSTTAKVTPPSLGGPWTNYKLTVCKTGTSTCKTFNCAPANIAACPLTGLDPSTSYTVEVVAQKTGFPDSLLGGPDTFKTKDAATPPEPHAEAQSDTTAQVTVKAPTVGGPCAKYALRICPTLNNPAGCFDRDCGPPDVTVSPTGTTTCPAITGLTGGTSYTVTATCIKADGSKGPTSAPETFATPSAGAPAVAADPVNAVSGVALCTKPSSGGPWTKFELSVCKKGTTQCLQGLPLCTAGAGSVTSCPINGCEPGTEYDVTIFALKADNTKSPISNTDSFKTPAAPAPGISVNDDDTTDTSTTAKVTPPSLGSGWINYKLTVCKVGVTPCTTVNCAPANIAACPIDNLSPSTDYTVTVVAQKPGFPDSLVGGPDSFKTDATPLVGSLTACTSDDGCLRATGELCDGAQKVCYCPSDRAWCPGTVGEPFCCGAGQTCGDVIIRGVVEQGCRCSNDEYQTCLGNAPASNGCKATSSASNPFTCAQCDADRATCEGTRSCGKPTGSAVTQCFITNS